MNTPCRAVHSLHATLGWLWFSAGGFKWFSCTQHQSSLLAYLLSTLQSPHAYHSFRLLSSHCLRIQLLHPQRAFTAHHVPWPPFSSSPRPRHMMPHECPLPSCSFSARNLLVTVNFGRGLHVVFLHSVISLVSVPSSSVFHASSAACHLAITSIIIHTFQLSSHCLRIQPLHPHRASGHPPLVIFQKDPAAARFVCVFVWTIWRDVKLLSFAGAVAHSWVQCQRSYSWVGRISGLIIPTYLHFCQIEFSSVATG